MSEEIKKTPQDENGVYKVNLSAKKEKEEEVNESETNNNQSDEKESDEKEGSLQNEEVTENKDDGQEEAEKLQEVEEESESEEEQSESVLEAIEDEASESNSSSTEDTEQPEQVTEQEETESNDLDLPENLQKVVEFMNETNGSLEDYVRLNTDYSNADENTLLREYYKKQNPHLDKEDIDFMLEEFSYDEDIDEEKDIKRKKLKRKQEVGKAKSYLNELKDKYYDEVKLGSKLSPEQKEAVEFYNKHKEESDRSKESRKDFSEKTNQLFNDEFKGFEYKVGDKKFRYKADAGKVKETQSDLSNIYNKYFDKNGKLADPKGYHKSVFASQDPDAFAEHFYNQGKADAIKGSIKGAKNLNMDGRKDHSNNKIKAKGKTYKVISGEDTSEFKIKRKL